MAKNISKSYLSVVLVFIYWISYENTFFFEAGSFGPIAVFIANFIKLVIPVVLILMNGIPKFPIKSHVFYYVFIFCLFIFYALLPTLVSGDLVEYLKLFPRLIFFIAILKLFHKIENIVLLSKLIIGYVVFTFFQHVIGYTFRVLNIDLGVIEYGNLMWHGPLGVFGNLNIVTSFFGFPFIQLRGFWNEPSNASGAIFSTYFLVKFLNEYCDQKLPKFVIVVVLLAGFLTFSLIGFISFFVAFLYGVYFEYKRSRNFLKFIRYSPIFILLLLYIFSRSILANGKNDNEFLLAITGAHKIVDKQDVDVSGGRFDVINGDIKTLQKYPFGIGVQNVIGKVQGIVPGNVIAENISASAPIFWLVLTGYLGLFLLLLRDFFLFRVGWINTKYSKQVQYLFQAFLCFFIQNLSYGTFMTGYYFILSGFVLAFIRKKNESNLVLR